MPSARIETIIGPNTHFRGEIISEGGVRIDGIFEGNIETTSNLVIGESAKIIAEIKANNVSISGAVKGNVTGNRVEVLETGRVWGDLTVNSLLLNEGAYLRGQTTMHADIEPPMIEAPKSAPSAEPGRPGTIVDVQPARSTQSFAQEPSEE
ncbi:MAG: polymer-forming cytoskeletal protein [Anaerolineae bacterium]|nr:polymer-forming cytoskeletal protein [Anaerolineae bacterium]